MVRRVLFFFFLLSVFFVLDLPARCGMLRPRQENVSSPTIRRKTEENYATDHASQSSKESRLGKPAESTNKLLQTKDVNQKPQSTQRSVSGKGYDKVALSSPKQSKIYA